MDFGKMVQVWQNALLKPKETYPAEAKNASVGLNEGLIGYGIAIVISVIVSSVLQMAMSLAGFGMKGGNYGAGMEIAAIAISIPIAIVISIVFMFIWTGIMHILAGMMGGKGAYGKFVYMYSIGAAPIMLISLVSIIPCLGTIVALAAAIYGLYLLTLAIQNNYGLDTMKAIMVWLIPLVAMIVIIVVLAVVVGVALMGTIAGLAGASGLGSTNALFA